MNMVMWWGRIMTILFREVDFLKYFKYRLGGFFLLCYSLPVPCPTLKNQIFPYFLQGFNSSRTQCKPRKKTYTIWILNMLNSTLNIFSIAELGFCGIENSSVPISNSWLGTVCPDVLFYVCVQGKNAHAYVLRNVTRSFLYTKLLSLDSILKNPTHLIFCSF